MNRLIIPLVCCLTASLSHAETILPALQGENLVKALREKYKPHTSLSYKAARQQMFTKIDNKGGVVTLVYTGAQLQTNTIPSDKVANCEHTWPQSKFKDAQGENRMKTDLHHLFPTLSKVNNARGSKPFADIPDPKTEAWYRSNDAETSIPQTSVRDQYSESTATHFEPREAHKGNAARALLYFHTIYGGDKITHDWFAPQLPTLLKWHKEDPADAAEIARTNAIAALQGNKNPFVIDQNLAKRVFSGSN